MLPASFLLILFVLLNDIQNTSSFSSIYFFKIVTFVIMCLLPVLQQSNYNGSRGAVSIIFK